MEQISEPIPLNPQERYFSLPKTIGEASSKELLLIAEELAGTQEYASTRTRILHNSIVSSAIIEAILTTDDSTHEFDDDHIDGIDLAEVYLHNAYEAKYEQIQAGFDPPSDVVELLRMTVRSKFMRVYKDMVCGEISEETQTEIRDSLAQEMQSYDQRLTDRYSDRNTRQQLSGLKGEVAVLSKYWQDYPTYSPLIALPATLRGDDGNKRPDETHDLMIFTEAVPGSFTYVKSIEVKSGRTIRKKMGMLARYANTITHINTRTGAIQDLK